jgi:transmembrane sensor
MNKELDEFGDKQMDEAKRVGYLVAGYLKNTLTEEEKDELDAWVTASDENMRFFVKLTDEKNIEKGLKERGIYDADKAVERLKQKIAGKYRRPATRIPLWAIGIAACVVLLVGLFVVLNRTENRPSVSPPLVTTKDVAPGTSTAVLTLSDGRTLGLDTIRGSIAGISGATAVNSNGGIAYSTAADQSSSINTISTPRGGQYQLALSDGSKVWLNAASSVKFPTAFNGKDRKVEITGEAYFEVAHDPYKAFYVEANGAEIKVLGTHFNVNAYDNEDATRVTLLQGSVRVNNDKGATTIQPGQQAVVATGREPAVTTTPDLDEVMAWKNGVFEFKDASIEEIMKQVERWYNVRVTYEAKPSYHFNASIKRDVPVSKLFRLLELTDQVHFTIDNNTITVKQ